MRNGVVVEMIGGGARTQWQVEEGGEPPLVPPLAPGSKARVRARLVQDAQLGAWSAWHDIRAGDDLSVQLFSGENFAEERTIKALTWGDVTLEGEFPPMPTRPLGWSDFETLRQKMKETK